MRLRLRHFAALRERRGRAEEELDVPDGSTAAGLYATLFPPGPEGALFFNLIGESL